MIKSNLLELAAANPELPIIAMVNGEICWDDSCHWLGAFGTAYVDYIGVLGDRYYDDQDDFKEAYYDLHDEELCEKYFDEVCIWRTWNSVLRRKRTPL